jgi:hypothetical protein
MERRDDRFDEKDEEEGKGYVIVESPFSFVIILSYKQPVTADNDRELQGKRVY